MDIQRALKHLAMTDRQVRRAFPAPTLRAIEQAIKASEAGHCGEVRFVVAGALELGCLHVGSKNPASTNNRCHRWRLRRHNE